ncbi:DNA mismatch repair protein [Cordyceps javanica]|uniref:DNA mismatch repair protein n=1 Tax=Cordyceps javanica TaxID=43265 RepID=A0A545VZ86_9HYPO|nr:DNA mismatch repair protein [Cordyceps javanica]TQW07031.1 DNA mismatch repair protein [Cordyceps javanica]
MPIAKLGPETARLIGSSAGITSPYAVVKELLENAIDARADTVEILISPNTLDQIRVRDNGRGVSLDDLDALGRPGHTSKLTAFDELAAGRVPTLGFRGYGLANIIQVTAAGGVHVVTRTSEEPVAAKVQLLAGAAGCREGEGEGVGRRFGPVSAPTGTEVHAAGLFGNMPPRRQRLLKESKKTMTRIKELLPAYVLANANLRIGFKVLGDDKQSCWLGQTRERDMKQSVLEVFGVSVAANGQTHRFAGGGSAASGTADIGGSTGVFTLVAFLPNPDGDQKAMAGKGSFISVNGRPLSSTMGIGKALAGVFKAKIQQSWQQRGQPPVQKPLLLLEISCPFSEYDANTATLKDDVLFVDADGLLRTFEELCSTVYGKIAAVPGRTGPRATNQENKNDNATTTDCSMMPAKMETLVSVQMRTTSSVNMCRTNSNTTDEGIDFQEVLVTVPERRPLSEEKESARYKAKKPHLATNSAPKQLVRGIERYFEPIGTDFEIATDETATPERPPQPPAREETSSNRSSISSGSLDREKGAARGAFERMPLNDVPDSALNTLAGGIRDSSPSGDDSSHQGDGPRLSDLHSTSWSIRNLLQQRVLDVPSRGSSSNNSSSHHNTTMSASPVPQTRGQRDEVGRRVVLRPQLPMTTPIRSTTPPSSSDPVNRHEPFFVPAASYVEVSGLQPSPASSSTSGRSAPVEEPRATEQQQGQVIRLQALPSTRNGQRSYRGGFASGVITAPAPLGRSPPATRPRQHQHQQIATAGRPLARRQEYEGNGNAATPEGGSLGRPGFMGHGCDRRTADLPLLRQANPADDQTSDVESVDTPPRPKRRRGQDAAGQVRPAKQGDQRLVLPLESIPPDMATWRNVLTTDVDFSDVRILMGMERQLDLYITSGTLALGLRGVTRHDAVLLESRVRRLCRV